MSEDIKYSCLEHGWLDLDGLCEQCLLREAKCKTADTKRPRVYFVNPVDDKGGYQPCTEKDIPFIEKSAYDALKKDYLESSGAMNKEIAELEAELAACKASMNAHDKSRAKVLLKVAELEAEREQLRNERDEYESREKSRIDLRIEIKRLEKQVAELKATMSRPQLEVVTDYIAACKERDALQSRLAECEARRDDLIEDLKQESAWHKDVRQKLAAAEAEIESLQLKLGEAGVKLGEQVNYWSGRVTGLENENAELLQWCERLAKDIRKWADLEGYPVSTKAGHFLVWGLAEFEAWKKERGV